MLNFPYTLIAKIWETKEKKLEKKYHCNIHINVFVQTHTINELETDRLVVCQFVKGENNDDNNNNNKNRIAHKLNEMAWIII